MNNNLKIAPPSFRLGAFIIDVFILTVIELIVVFLLINFGFLKSEEINSLADIGKTHIGKILAVTLYFPIFTAIYKASPGKKLLKLKVVSFDGNDLSIPKILLRESFGRAAGMVVFGWATIFFTKDRETLWDYFVGSLVIKDS